MPQINGVAQPLKAKRNQVIFCSRLDSEKQPHFMMEVARAFLTEFRDWEWIVTTSAEAFRSNDDSVVDALAELSQQNPRFLPYANLSKAQYYATLCESRIQFNCSLQDYVSWTLLEACLAGCDIAYPNFRSFPECVPLDRLYQPWSVSAAVSLLGLCIADPQVHGAIPERCGSGLFHEADIVSKRTIPAREFNIWHRNDD
jgi:hypothetical protein